MKMQLPPLLEDAGQPICVRCLYDRADDQFSERCPASKSGKHKWERRQPWAVVVIGTIFGASPSTAKRALVIDGTPVDPRAYPFARRLTAEELDMLRTGEGEMRLSVERKEPRP